MKERKRAIINPRICLDREKQREIARKGGQSVPNDKRSFSQNHQLASEAGRKGGTSSHGRRGSQDTAQA